MADRSVELEFNTNLDKIGEQITALESKLKDIQSKGLTLELSFDATKISTELSRLKSEFELDKSIANIIGPKESYTALQKNITDLTNRIEELRGKSDLLNSQLKQQTAMFGEDINNAAQKTKKELKAVTSEILANEKALTQAVRAENELRTEARRAADKAAVDEEKAAQEKMLGTFKGYQNRANEIIMQFKRASAGSIGTSDIEVAKGAYEDLFKRISSFLDNPLVRFNESISASALATQDKIMSIMDAIGAYELKTSRDTANKEKAEKLEEYQAYQKARLRVTNEYSKITEAYEGKRLETFDESKIKSDIELLKKLRAETKASFDYEAITEQEQHDLDNLIKMIDNRMRALDTELSVRAKNSAKADSKARADAEAAVNDEIKATRQKFYNDLNTEMQKYNSSAKLNGFSTDEINSSISNLEKLKTEYKSVFETDNMTEAERAQLISFIEDADRKIKTLNVELARRSDEEKRKADKDRADKEKADKERERQQMAALHSYYDQVHELETEEKKRQEADAAQKAKDDKEREKQQLAAMHSYYEQVHALEEERHKQSVKNRQDAVNGIKDIAKLYSDTINGTITTIRNGLKTIKSLSANLSSILGIEDVQLNVNSILKQSLSTYAGVFESVNLLDQMYEKDISTMLDWAENQSRAYGIASQNAREYLGQISGMLSNLGIEAEDARETMTINYVKMAGDLASAFNKSTDQAFLAIRSGIAGMTRPLEQFGINLKITALDEWVKSNDKIRKQLGDIAYKDLSEANKQMVRYAYILEKASESQGDFSRTSSSFSNEIKTLKNEWQNLLEVIGKFAVSAFRPVVEWLIKAIQYAKYFVEVLAKVFGWQIDWEQDTVKFYQSETDAVDDNTDAIKKKNKELKKGVKLLDLYELDFGDNKDDDGNGGDDFGPKQNLLEGLADKYKDADFDFKFKLNEKEMQDVRKFVDDVKKFFDTVWNFQLGPFPSIGELIEDAVDKFTKRPGEFILDIFGAIFATSTIKNVARKVVGPYLQRVLTSDDVLNAIKNPTTYNRIMGIGTVVAGAIVTGIGGFNWGQAIESGNTMDSLLGGFETISGIIMTTIGGLMVGGPIGAAVGFGVGLVTAIVSGMVGASYEKQQQLMEVAKNLIGGPLTLTEYYASKINEVFGNAEVSTQAFNTYNEAIEGINSDLETLYSTEIPNALSALNVDPKNTKKIDDVKKAFDRAKGAVVELSQEESKFTTTVLQQQFSDANGKIDSFHQNIIDTIGALEQLNGLQKAKELERLKQLEILQSKGKIEAKSAEETELEELRAKYKATQEIVDELPGIDAKFDATSQSLEDFGTQLTNSLSVTQTVYDTSSRNLKEAYENGFITADEYTVFMDELNKHLDTIKQDAKKLYEEAAENVQDTLTFAVKTTLVAVAPDKTLYDAKKEAMQYAGIDLDSETPITDYVEKINIRPEPQFFDFEDIPDKILTELCKQFGLSPSEQDFKSTAKKLYQDLLFHINFNVNATEEGITFKSMGTPDNERLAQKALQTAGYKTTLIDGKLTAYMPTEPTFEITKADFVVKTGAYTIDEKAKESIISQAAGKTREMLASKKNSDAISNGTNDAASNADYDDAAQTTADDYTDKTAAAIENDADKLTEATSNAIATAANTDEAKQKGSELGNAYMDGLATAINTNSNYKTALQQLVDGFKNALNSISSNINEWSKHLSDGVAALNIPDDVTFSSLMGILKTNNLNIKPLAAGGVIPPNNPFLAMLGDQRSGVNIEAPLTTIQEAVREVVQPEQNIEVSVYIGNQELRDFVVDTVVDNNLIKG